MGKVRDPLTAHPFSVAMDPGGDGIGAPDLRPTDRRLAARPGSLGFPPAVRRRRADLVSVQPWQIRPGKYLVADGNGRDGEAPRALRNRGGGFVGDHANGKSGYRNGDSDGDWREASWDAGPRRPLRSYSGCIVARRPSISPATGAMGR